MTRTRIKAKNKRTCKNPLWYADQAIWFNYES